MESTPLRTRITIGSDVVVVGNLVGQSVTQETPPWARQ